MNDNELKNFATFNLLITPRLIAISYWILSLLVIITGTWLWTLESLVTMVVTLVLVRIGFELIMVSFKNNEYLRRICEATETKKQSNRQR